MNRILEYSIKIVATLFVATFLFSCGPTTAEKEEARVKRDQTPNPITWDTISVNKTEVIEIDKKVDPECSFTMSYIIPKEYQKLEIIQDIQKELNYVVMGEEDSFREMFPNDAVSKLSNDYLENCRIEAKSDYSLSKNIGGDEKLFSYNLKIETEVMYNESNLISYQYRAVEHWAVDASTVIYKNILFDLTNGTRLREQDIFEEEYREELNRSIIEQLLRNNGVQTVQELQEMGYWGAGDIAANNNFFIDKKGITYTFNPGEYGNEELGVLKVTINYDDLLPLGILKNDSPISILF